MIKKIDKIKYGKRYGIKYLGECLCIKSINNYIKERMYDYYIIDTNILAEDSSYWVVYNYNGKDTKQGYWFSFYDSVFDEEYFFDYFIKDIKEIRKIKIDNLNSNE
jgi:hypothetical protein